MNVTMLNKKDPICPNFIIAGTNKAATTSVFTCLSAHPQVCGSSVKETFFFRKQYAGNRSTDIKNYSKYFEHCGEDARIIMEATPGYLTIEEDVPIRIRELLPDVKLLFVLRDPVERFYSYYKFQVSLLVLDENISLDEFFAKCMEYVSGSKGPKELGIEERILKGLECGRYAEYLKRFYDVFPREQIKVMFYEDLKDDIVEFMCDLCEFLDIDAQFYKGYKFEKVNVTSMARNKILHAVALKANLMLERYLRQRPVIKKWIRSAYHCLNISRGELPVMSDEVRSSLEEYYSEANRKLAEMLAREELPQWLR